MHVFARLPRCATYTAIFLPLNGCKRAHPPVLGACSVAHLWLHAHQKILPDPARASILPDKYLHMGLQGNFLKTRTPARPAPPRPPSPLSLHFADQIPLSRSRILALYWCVYVYPTPPFLRMCARRLYNRGGGGGGGILEHLCWPRKIWYSEEGEEGGIGGLWPEFCRNWREFWIGERG